MTDYPTGSKQVRYEVRDGVAWITLNRPEAHNALNEEIRTGLTRLAERFNADPEARVLVLTGSGKSFCAGADLKEMAANGTAVPAPEFIPQFGRTIQVDKPTIAAVNGPALGGGFLLAQNCDLVIAADTARFAISEIKWGRGAPWAIPLAHLIPPRVATELLTTGDPIDAQRALAVGLVNKVVPLAGLADTAQALAASIAANAPLSVLAGKQTVRLALEYPPAEAFARAEELWAPVYSSKDAQEGPRAFREKRRPAWQGR